MFNRFSLLILLFVACFTQMAIGQQSKIDPYLSELLRIDENPQDCLISFYNQSDVKVPTQLSKTEKGQMVYEILKLNQS